VDHQYCGTLAGDSVVIGEIAFQLDVAVAVLDPLGLDLGLRRRCKQGGEQERSDPQHRHGNLPR
jgi:hypothetical protein